MANKIKNIRRNTRSNSRERMAHFDDQTAKDLEFDAVKGLLLNHCHNPTAIDRAKQLHPRANPKSWRQELERTKEFLNLRSEGVPFPSVGVEEIADDNDRLAVRDSVLDEASFNRIRTATETVNGVIEALEDKVNSFPRLSELTNGLEPNQELPQSIDKVFDSKGEVRSNASPKLIQIREAKTRLRRNLNRQFLKELKKNQERGWLADTKEGFINQRRVLAVNSTHKRKIAGTALGQSKNASITFIEPASTVSMNFEMEMLKDDERKEIHNILRALTHQIRHFLPDLRCYHSLLVELDWVRAKSQLAREMNADLPGIRDDENFHLIKAYHPLLAMQNTAKGLHTEPQTLQLQRKERMLVISGPNAGGKSIALKTVGLLQVMLQSGLLIPAHPNSEMGCFRTVLTDIGDNQSIENELSTYSYRLNRMKGFLDVANQSSLLLLDEFGTGSDPELGGALAEVFFEELYNRGSYAVITTHYANIKTKAAQLPEAINGSMRFDQESLKPLFKLDIGTPGSSFTFEVAHINGIDRGIIKRAKGKLDHRKVKLDELISELQKEKNTLAKVTDRHLKKELELEQLKLAVNRREQHINDRAEAQHLLAENNNEALHRGRKLQQFIDKYESGSRNKALIEDIEKYLAVEKTKRLENDAAKQAKKRTHSVQSSKRRPKHFIERIKVGSTVRLRNGGKERGEVIAMHKNAASVMFGAFKSKIELEKLSWVAN
ncbi:MAG: DNA mismatch repair protein MutS [Crocinitomicaceae bacterium]|nr:DNA mismatch repair protein MutS [Crocinitomicaceae bacterium]